MHGRILRVGWKFVLTCDPVVFIPSDSSVVSHKEERGAHVGTRVEKDPASGFSLFPFHRERGRVVAEEFHGDGEPTVFSGECRADIALSLDDDFVSVGRLIKGDAPDDGGAAEAGEEGFEAFPVYAVEEEPGFGSLRGSGSTGARAGVPCQFMITVAGFHLHQQASRLGGATQKGGEKTDRYLRHGFFTSRENLLPGYASVTATLECPNCRCAKRRFHPPAFNRCVA